MATRRTVQFEIRGQDARALAEALRDEIKKLLPEYEVQTQEHAAPRRGAERAVDPLTVFAVALGVPSAIDATLSLADRMRLSSKVDALIGWARERCLGRDARVLWSREGGAGKPLDEAKTAEIVQALHDLRERGQGRRS